MAALGASGNEVVVESTRKLFGRGLMYVFIWSLGLVAGVLIIPLVTRVLGVEGFGRLAAALAIGQVLVVTVGLGMQAAIIRQHVDEGGDASARGLLFAAIVFGFGLTAVLYLTGPIWSRYLGFESFSGAIRIIVIWGFPASACQAAMGLLRAQDRLGAFSAVSIVQSAGAQLLALGALFLFTSSAEVYTCGLLIGQGVAFLLSVVVTHPRPAGITDTETIRAALRLGLPLVPQGLAVFILSAGDRLVIQRLLGPAAVGRYQVGYSVGSLILLLMASLNQSWEASVLSIVDETHRSKVIARARDQLLRCIQPLVVALVAISPIALRVFAPPTFLPSELTVVVALVAASATPYAFYLSNVLKLLSVRRTKSLAVASGACAIANIGLCFLLIPFIGIDGAALATILAFALQAVISQMVSRRHLFVPGPSAAVAIYLLGGGASVYLMILAPQLGIWIWIRIGIAGIALAWGVRMVSAAARPKPMKLRIYRHSQRVKV